MFAALREASATLKGRTLLTYWMEPGDHMVAEWYVAEIQGPGSIAFSTFVIAS